MKLQVMPLPIWRTFAGGPLTLSSASSCFACTLSTITASRLGVLSTFTWPWLSFSLLSSCGTPCLHSQHRRCHDIAALYSSDRSSGDKMHSDRI